MLNLKLNKSKKPNPLFTDVSITNRTKDGLTLVTNTGLSREIHPSALAEKGLDITLDEIHVPVTWMENWFSKILADIKQTEDNRNKSLFYKNIALLIANKEFIMSDRKYFMTPVRGVNFGVYKVGNFNDMPIGAWLQIWSLYPDTIDICTCGGIAPIVSFGGSPLSGAHSRTAICLKCGKTIENSSGKFSPIWKPFAKVQKKYKGFSKHNAMTFDKLIEVLE